MSADSRVWLLCEKSQTQLLQCVVPGRDETHSSRTFFSVASKSPSGFRSFGPRDNLDVCASYQIWK
jgi:hypothetical protein